MVDLKIFLIIRFQILRHFHLFESEEASDAMSARREAHATSKESMNVPTPHRDTEESAKEPRATPQVPWVLGTIDV